MDSDVVREFPIPVDPALKIRSSTTPVLLNIGQMGDVPAKPLFAALTPPVVNNGEDSGLNVDYYTVDIKDPKRLDPYKAECEDIIEALGMNFAEGTAFKAIWRRCAARTLGKLKKGNTGKRDAEKVIYYGQRMLAQDARGEQ